MSEYTGGMRLAPETSSNTLSWAH